MRYSQNIPMDDKMTFSKTTSSILSYHIGPKIFPSRGIPVCFIDFNPGIIVCVYFHHDTLNSVTINFQTRKAISRVTSKQTPSPKVDTDTFVIKENNKTMIVVRCSCTEFHILSVPRLRFIDKFSLKDSN